MDTLSMYFSCAYGCYRIFQYNIRKVNKLIYLLNYQIIFNYIYVFNLDMQMNRLYQVKIISQDILIILLCSQLLCLLEK